MLRRSIFWPNCPNSCIPDFGLAASMRMVHRSLQLGLLSGVRHYFIPLGFWTINSSTVRSEFSHLSTFRETFCPSSCSLKLFFPFPSQTTRDKDIANNSMPIAFWGNEMPAEKVPACSLNQMPAVCQGRICIVS